MEQEAFKEKDFILFGFSPLNRSQLNLHRAAEADSKQMMFPAVIKHTNIIDVGGGKDRVSTFGEVLFNFMKFYLSLLCQ